MITAGPVGLRSCIIYRMTSYPENPALNHEVMQNNESDSKLEWEPQRQIVTNVRLERQLNVPTNISTACFISLAP